MPKIFSLCNQKGGVGKTTTAINLATAVALKNYRVLLIDLDPQGNATSGLGIDRSGLSKTIYSVLTEDLPVAEATLATDVPNLSLVPSNVDLTGAEIELIDAVGREFVLREALKKVGQGASDPGLGYDFIFIDCPPSLGILTLNALVAADRLLIPLQCEYYALEGLGQLLNTFKLVKDRLNNNLEIGGVILTMADFRTNLTGEVIKEVRSHFSDKVYETIIPRSVKLSEAPSFGKPALIYDSSNRGSQSYVLLGAEFIKKEAAETKVEEAPVNQAAGEAQIS
ncbi:MAG: ParA family protein [Candidatus Omnitrophica bacterium]|nr:ParA family protein [Candidatus Omnitrophota bacterium]